MLWLDYILCILFLLFLFVMLNKHICVQHDKQKEQESYAQNVVKPEHAQRIIYAVLIPESPSMSMFGHTD